MTTKATARPDGQCLFCESCRCFYRIFTDDCGFDEIACRDHRRDLEAYADSLLGSPGRKRCHQSSSARLRRRART